MNKREITKRIAKRMSITQEEASAFIKNFEGVLKEAVQEDDYITWQGFGSFRRIRQNERPGRNPRTGVPAIIPARITLKFRPSPFLIDHLNDLN